MLPSSLPPITIIANDPCTNRGYSAGDCGTCNQKSCYLHPRNDCNVPCCTVPPKCPEGVFVKRRKPFTPLNEYVIPKRNFKGISTYKEHFHAKCGRRAYPMYPYQTVGFPPGKCEAASTYRYEYPLKTGTKEESFKPIIKAKIPPYPRFKALSVYRVDYFPKSQKTASFKPIIDYKPSKGKMEKVTSYRSKFIPFNSNEIRTAKQPSAKKSENANLFNRPFLREFSKNHFATTYQHEYWPKRVEKLKPLKPYERRYKQRNLEVASTYRNDYGPFYFKQCKEYCVPARVYDKIYPRCGLFACGAEPEKEQERVYEDPCPLPSTCLGCPSTQDN